MFDDYKSTDNDREYAISNPASRFGNIFFTITNIFRFMLLFLIALYLFYFIPLSYLKPEQIRSIWITTWVLITYLGILSTSLFALNILSFAFSKRMLTPSWLIVSALLYLGIFSYYFILGSQTILSLAGLLPVSMYINPVPIAFLFLIVNFLPLISLMGFYRSYLLQITSLVQNGSVYIIILVMVVLVFDLGDLVRSIMNFSKNYIDVAVDIIQISALATFAYIAYKIANRIRVGTIYSFEMILAIILTISVFVFRFAVGYAVDYFYLSFLTMLIVLDYYDTNPTQRKTNKILFSGFAAFCIFSTLSFIDTDYIQSSPFFTVPQNIISVGTIVVNVIILFRKYDKEKSGGIDIPDEAIQDAAKELISSNGISISTGAQIINLCTMSEKYDVAENIIDIWRDSKSLPSDDLAYLQSFVFCAKMTTSGEDEIIVPSLDPAVSKRVVTKNEFKKFINEEVFPQQIGSHETWTYIAENSYIAEYVEKKKIKQIEPYNILKKLQDTAYTVGRVLLVVLVVFQFLASSLVAVLPSAFAGILLWHNVRVNEMRLKFTEAFTPYKFNDEYKRYYAYQIPIWVDSWKYDNGLMEKGKSVVFRTEKLDQALHWYSLVPIFYTENDAQYQYVKYRIGDLYNAKSNCAEAVGYLQDIDMEIINPSVRDEALNLLAKCYVRLNKRSKSIEVLQIADLPTDIKSRSLLASMYLEDDNYEGVISALSDIEKDLDEYAKADLGLAYLKTGKTDDANQVLKDALDISIKNANKEQEAKLTFLLAEAQYQSQNYFYSADNFYRSLSDVWRYKYNLPKKYFDAYSPHFKEAIDMVSELNPDDTRVNLWNYVYYSYIGDSEKAKGYFQLHLQESPEYEEEFVKWLLNLPK